MQIAARLIAVLALGAAMTAAIMAVRGDETSSVPSQRSDQPGGDPGRAELQRCRDLGLAAAGDANCLKTWSEYRRRFLGTERADRPQPEAAARGREQPASP